MLIKEQKVEIQCTKVKICQIRANVYIWGLLSAHAQNRLDMPFKYRVMYRTVFVVYKSLNELTPEYLSNMFTPLTAVSQRTTRNSTNNNLWIPNSRLTCTRNGLRYTGPAVYNLLPRDLKTATSMPYFKRKSYDYFFNMYINSNS